MGYSYDLTISSGLERKAALTTQPGRDAQLPSLCLSWRRRRVANVKRVYTPYGLLTLSFYRNIYAPSVASLDDCHDEFLQRAL